MEITVGSQFRPTEPDSPHYNHLIEVTAVESNACCEKYHEKHNKDFSLTPDNPQYIPPFTKEMDLHCLTCIENKDYDHWRWGTYIIPAYLEDIEWISAPADPFYSAGSQKK